MTGRIAFVHFPHSADKARLETMPFAMQSIRALARAGWQVDVFLWQTDTEALSEAKNENIRYRRPGFPELRLPKRFQAILHALRYGLFGGYRCVFGLGQVGIVVAKAIAQVSRCPLIYFNEELPSTWAITAWTELERKAVRYADFLVSQDARRNRRMLADLKLPQETPTGVLYNAPRLDGTPPAIDWHRRLGIPSDRHIVLHAGSLADWAQVPELLATVPSWPDSVVLLLHSRSHNEAQRYRRELSHLHIDGRIYWSDAPLVEDELHSLISSSIASLGLYRVSSPNIELMGYSSGKIMRSLVCGTPVIASAIPSLDFVTEFCLGVQVRHPAEVAQHLRKLIAHRDEYRANCQAFISTEVSFDKAWNTFCAKFTDITGLDLARAGARGSGNCQ